MEDQFGKYLRLFGTLFFTFIGLILAFILLMTGIRLLFGVLSYIPFISYFYVLLIVSFPTTLFVTAYIIYLRRTAFHPSKTTRIISYCIFTIAFLAWGYFFSLDMVLFFRHFYSSIDKYHTYNLLFLFANVACFFFVGILQAFTTEKEKDWMQKRLDRQN